MFCIFVMYLNKKLFLIQHDCIGSMVAIGYRLEIEINRRYSQLSVI